MQEWSHRFGSISFEQGCGQECKGLIRLPPLVLKFHFVLEKPLRELVSSSFIEELMNDKLLLQSTKLGVRSGGRIVNLDPNQRAFLSAALLLHFYDLKESPWSFMVIKTGGNRFWQKFFSTVVPPCFLELEAALVSKGSLLVR